MNHKAGKFVIVMIALTFLFAPVCVAHARGMGGGGFGAHSGVMGNRGYGGGAMNQGHGYHMGGNGQRGSYGGNGRHMGRQGSYMGGSGHAGSRGGSTGQGHMGSYRFGH